MVADVSTLVAAWIDEVHEALRPVSRPLSGAQWGPVTMAHATARPEWFSSFDRAWARPWQGSDPDVSLVSASFADLPSSVSPPPLRRGDLGPRGEVVGLEETDVRLVWQEAAGHVLGWDPATGQAVLLTAAEPSGYDQVSPLRFLVHWTAAASGGFLAHAATVGRGGHGEEPRGLLLLGDAGYGKSTTTLAALNHGWVTCGDDAVLVRPDARGWAAYAVYAAVKTKLQPGQEAPAGPDVVTWDIHGHKRAHLLTATDDRLLTPSMRIDGLLALDPWAPADRPWATIDPAAARRVGAPNTVMPLPFDRAAVLSRFGQACSELPARVLPRRQSLDDTLRDLGEIVDDVRPRVSVILPVYNGARFLARDRKSVV